MAPQLGLHTKRISNRRDLAPFTKWMSRYILRPRSFRTKPFFYRNPFVFRSASGLRACHGMARIIPRNLAQPRNLSVQRWMQRDLTIKLEFASHSWFAEPPGLAANVKISKSVAQSQTSQCSADRLLLILSKKCHIIATLST